jgi:toluene monooxygenase system protein E
MHFRDRSPLIKAVVEAGGWDDYSDPYELVYWRYNSMADEEETHVDRILEEIVRTKHDWNLGEEWLTFMRDYYDPLRFLWHTFQMHSMYIGHMSLSSTMTNVFTFMGMDHLRRTQRVAQRIKMLDIVYPGFGFGTRGRVQWEEDPAYQPAREAIERMLATYDVTEALVSFTLGIKFTLDELLLVHVGELADRNGDHMLRHIHFSFYRDTMRHRDQVQALFKYAFEKTTQAKPIIEETLSKWIKAAYDAVDGFKPLFEERLPNTMRFSDVKSEVRSRHREYLDQLDIGVRLP